MSNIREFSRPTNPIVERGACCDGMKLLEDREIVAATETGMSFIDGDEIVADFTYCPFCLTRITVK